MLWDRCEVLGKNTKAKRAFNILTLLFKENKIPTLPLSRAECTCYKSSQS